MLDHSRLSTLIESHPTYKFIMEQIAFCAYATIRNWIGSNAHIQF